MSTTSTLAETAADDTQRWDVAPLPALVAHIVGHYHLGLRLSLPNLVWLATEVEAHHANEPSCPKGLAQHLEQMHESVLDHLSKEEQILFPTILRGHAARVAAPVYVMELEHEQHKQDLQKIRALTGDLVTPPEPCTTWRALYAELLGLERNLLEHIHLENNVLFPRALAR